MILSLIAAVSENGVIGNKGKIPWHLPDDLKHFHNLTVGHVVVMGRKTYESIPEKHRPLPERVNIVLSRHSGEIPGCIIVHSLEEAMEQAHNSQLTAHSSMEIFVIGGGEMYREALPLAQRIYLTRVHIQVEGDACFPDIPVKEWAVVQEERHAMDERNQYAFTFQEYRRQDL